MKQFKLRIPVEVWCGGWVTAYVTHYFEAEEALPTEKHEDVAQRVADNFKSTLDANGRSLESLLEHVVIGDAVTVKVNGHQEEKT